MKNPTTQTQQMSNPPILDKNLHPVNTTIQMETIKPQIPWKFGIKQNIQSKKIRASTGSFKNLSGNLTSGTIDINLGTATNVLFNQGTIENSQFSAGTINTSIFEGGTINGLTAEGGTVNNGIFNNGVLGTPLITGGTYVNGIFNNGILGTPTITGGTINNGIIGTPSLTGGTVNPAAYQAGGTVGVVGTFSYIKTINFIGQTDTLGTIIVQNGIVTSIT